VREDLSPPGGFPPESLESVSGTHTVIPSFFQDHALPVVFLFVVALYLWIILRLSLFMDLKN